MRRMAAIFHQNPEKEYTVSDFQRIVEEATGKKVKRNTLRVYLRRFGDMGISKEVPTSRSDEPAFQCASKFKAFSYLEGHFLDYQPRVTPTAPPIRPSTTVEHRDGIRIQLSHAELEAVQTTGDFRRFGRTPAYYQINTKDFSLKAWSSGKAHLFLKDDWREGVAKVLGGEVVERIEEEIGNGNLHQGMAREYNLPKGYRLPVNRPPLKIKEPDGSITVAQFGYSQLRGGEFDRHGKQDAPNGNLVEEWIYDDAKFRVDVVNKFSALESALRNLPETIGKAVGEAVSKAISENLNGKPDKPKPPQYVPKEPDKYDQGYG